MSRVERCAQAAAWGAACGFVFLCALATWERWPDDLVPWVLLGTTSGALIADRVIARMAPSVQLLAIAAMLGLGTAAAISRFDNKVLLSIITALGVTGVAAVVNLFAARRPAPVRLAAAVFVGIVSCVVLIAMVHLHRHGDLSTLRIPRRDMPILAIFGLVGLAAVPPLRADEAA